MQERIAFGVLAPLASSPSRAIQRVRRRCIDAASLVASIHRNAENPRPMWTSNQLHDTDETPPGLLRLEQMARPARPEGSRAAAECTLLQMRHDLAEAVRLRIAELKMSSDVLASRCATTRYSVDSMRRGTQLPSLEMLLRMARALGLSVKVGVMPPGAARQ